MSAPQLNTYVTDEEAQLYAWTSMLSWETFRGTENPQSCLKPDGTRLRGIELAPGLYLGRDRRFYGTSLRKPHDARLLSAEDVLKRRSLQQIDAEVAAKWNAYGEARIARLNAKRPPKKVESIDEDVQLDDDNIPLLETL